MEADSRRRSRIALRPLGSAATVALILVVAGLCTPAPGAGFSTDHVLTLAKRFAEFSDPLPDASQLGVDEILAFEEHKVFAYVLGCKPKGAGPGGEAPSLVRRVVFLKPSTFVVDDLVQVTVAVGDRTFQLTLPPGGADAGTIAVSQADGKTLLARRLFPSGILPHGPKGVAMLERWDRPYHGNRRPGWDVGRPASHLRKAVEDGAVRPGRAVILGCGSGTNAVYLAENGFDVTAIDIAPTALVRGEEKARRAGVRVRWVLADVLAPPPLGTFDFVFDRGCYHHVRRLDAAGFVKAVCGLARGGTQVLILAGNANEPRRSGPPRVKEEEIRGDFSALFDFQWLRQVRFDTTNPQGQGPLAWSVLLRRKAGETQTGEPK